MRFRSGLLIGLGVGYVLGTKAGRERYEQLRRAWQGFIGDPRVKRAIQKGKEAAQAGAGRGFQAVHARVGRASERVKERLSGEGNGQPGFD
ncbi:MAG: YtxH domain-containing protein [Actinomycetota bacterium]